ncbi:MAG: hypothetical protein J0L92_17400 [Deltaproteobacteria bacterium]|nr:hypothetical protein [Deltaproteobacteria bacterium]
MDAPGANDAYSIDDAWRDPFALPDVHWVADAAIDARHIVRCGIAACGEGEECCFADGRCFDPDTESCRFEGDAGAADVGERGCVSHSDCGPGFACASYGTSCLGVGYCTPIPTLADCGRDPVCGCDGVTYVHWCAAVAAGTRIVRQESNGGCGNPIIGIHGGLHTGPIACGNDSAYCGGTECCAASGLCLPSDCPECCYVTPPRTYACNSDDLCLRADPNAFCDADSCDAPLGACVRPEGSCTGELVPVCGCDGVSYVNRCFARAARVRVAHAGTCDDG